ncbi:hypothetical protein [Isoptericola nanjingensis]|uniref:hypothetical protein n=1 Tax=Isoptericola TaxID=254250 RepID=UPI003D1E63FA|nr:hypothetical protein [Isoptericola sp. QY 916]
MATVKFVASTRCLVCGQGIAVAVVHAEPGSSSAASHTIIANTGWHLPCRGHEDVVEELSAQCPECEDR